MGVGLLEIGVEVRKIMICTIRWSFRSVCCHPFLVGFLSFLIFLQRSYPLLFSLLVSASPVLVCTAVLLGTLLSFGQPNIPEIEREEKTTDEIASLKTEVTAASTIVERNGSFSVKRYDEERRNSAEKLNKQLSWEADKTSEDGRDDNFDVTAPLIEESSREIEWENKIIEQAQNEAGDLRHEQRRERTEEELGNAELTENQYSSIPNDEPLESDDDKSQADSFDSERVNVDSLDSPPRSPWKRIEEVEEEEKEEDGSSDSESDTAASSSPDASMTDIIPMLDELHPLLDEDTPQPLHLSHNGSNAASEHFPKSGSGSHDSEDETENHEDPEAADDENEDAEDEDDMQGDKEEQTKSAITWTEEDQKNLMDLGSSELERNQRLENLIARRRARKNLSMLPERNLIDLEGVDLPFTIQPISTRRHNPFDLPQDDSGLPPIPGSAPSILLPRRNPFDIPYDSSEEKLDLIGDDFREEFMTLQPRRHESFNVGPSVFASNRQEKQDIKLRPYFVPEGTVLEETSCSRFQRQSSELSESKVSSIPETESTVSVGDLEDSKLAEEDISEEPEASSKMEDVVEEVLSCEVEPISEMEDIVEEDIPHEPEPTSKIEDVSEFVGHGSQSSEDVESLDLDKIEKRDADIDELEIQFGDVENHYEEGNVAGSDEVQVTEFHSTVDAVVERYNSSSSSSSLSEASERIFNENEGEGLSSLEERRDPSPEGQDFPTRPSLEIGSFNITSASVDDNPYKDPVYDLSPQGCRENISLPSTSSDVHVESDPGMLPVLVKPSASFIEKEYEGNGREMDKSSSNLEMVTELSKQVDESQARTKNVMDARELNVMDSNFLEVDQIQSETSAEVSTEENCLHQRNSYQHAQGEVSISSSNKNIHAIAPLDAERSSKSCAFEDLDQQEDGKHSVISEQSPAIQPYEPLKRHLSSINEEKTVQSAENQGQMSDSDVSFGAGSYDEAEKKMKTSYRSKEKSICCSGDDLAFTDKPMNKPPFNHYSKMKEVPSTMVESVEEARTKDGLNIPNVKELDCQVSSHVNFDETETPASLLTLNTSFSREVGNGDPISKLHNSNFPAEAIDSDDDKYVMVEETDEIKEIDGLLAELDTVGDFNIKESQSSTNKFEKHMDSSKESLSTPQETAIAIEHVDSLNGGSTGTDVQNAIDAKVIEHNLNSEENNSGMHVVEARAIEDIESLFEEYRLKSMESNIVFLEPEMLHQGQVDIDVNSGVLEHEAQTLQDIDSAFEQTGNREIKKPDDIESQAVHKDGVDVDVNSGLLEVKALTLQDIDSAFKQISEGDTKKPVDVEPPRNELIIEESKVGEPVLEVKQIRKGEMEKPLDVEPLCTEAVIEETKVEESIPEVRSIEDVTSLHTQAHEHSVQTDDLPDSVDNARHVIESIDVQQPHSELHGLEAIASEDSNMESNQGDVEKNLKLEEDELEEVRVDEVSLSDKDAESTIKDDGLKEMNLGSAKEPDHDVEQHKRSSSDKSVKGKERKSQKSSSSSSLSSDSSDSD